MTIETLPTNNPAYGFFGTLALAGADADAGWNIASRLLCEALAVEENGGAYSPEAVRDFLDSRLGRHMADMVTGRLQAGLALEPAIAHAIEVHQSWRISRSDSVSHGIPRGLPFLTGWVGHFGILAESWD